MAPKTTVLPLALAALLAGPATAAPPSGPPPAGALDDEIVLEFQKYFRRYKEKATRVEAVLSLSGTESTAVVRALSPVLDDADPDVVRAAVRVLAGFETRPPIDAVFAGLEEARDEDVLLGLLSAVERGGYEGGGEALEPLLAHRSWPLRRRAALALASSGGEGAGEAILPLTGDREVAVRGAALDALARLRSPLAVEAGIAALSDPSWQVRASAVHALGEVRHRDSIEPLIERMEAEEGRLVADIGAALAEITGRDFGDRLDAWKNFWKTFRDRFEIPTDEELARLRAVQAERREQYDPSDKVVYHGVETPSRRILFVIDVSGSMEQEVIEKERFAGRRYPSWQRLDVVKTELLRTIEDLEPYVEFNVLAFATDIDEWKRRPVKANVLNKSSARSWIGRLKPIGGSSKEDLAAVGLVGSANLEAGKTNTYAALMRALGAEKGAEKDYETDFDTVFFLSDGRPSWGHYVDPDDIVKRVREANELRKVAIHTIAIGEFEKDFMEQLAIDSGGLFIDLGR